MGSLPRALRRPLGQALMLGLLIGASALPGCTSPGLTPVRDHAVIEPAQPVASAGRIEVIGFFWFGCPHCADMHRHLQAWRLRQPADVQFVPLPAVFKPEWQPAARLHLALALLGELDRTSGALFEAVQLDGIDLTREDAVLAWAASQGIARNRLADALRAPEVQARLDDALHWPQAYQLRGVPAFVVDGRYLTSNGFTGSPQDTLAVLDRLVQRAREARAARP
jgi:protein dithiol oxidoreductase (disulfide-forming)